MLSLQHVRKKKSKTGAVGDELEMNQCDSDDDKLVCTICKKEFTTEVYKEKHKCQGGRATVDLLTAGLKHALQLLTTGEVLHTDVRHGGSGTSTISIDQLDYQEERVDMAMGITKYVLFDFCRAWARRPKKGDMYGAKYLPPYKKDILDMFMAGVAENRNKLAPGKMVETLKAKYPGRMSLPSADEV